MALIGIVGNEGAMGQALASVIAASGHTVSSLQRELLQNEENDLLKETSSP